jgi:hypothetical protein
MTVADERKKTFESSVVLPALTEVSNSPALLKEYEAEVVAKRPSADAAAEELLSELAGAMGRAAPAHRWCLKTAKYRPAYRAWPAAT